MHQVLLVVIGCSCWACHGGYTELSLHQSSLGSPSTNSREGHAGNSFNSSSTPVALPSIAAQNVSAISTSELHDEQGINAAAGVGKQTATTEPNTSNVGSRLVRFLQKSPSAQAVPHRQPSDQQRHLDIEAGGMPKQRMGLIAAPSVVGRTVTEASASNQREEAVGSAGINPSIITGLQPGIYRQVSNMKLGANAKDPSSAAVPFRASGTASPAIGGPAFAVQPMVMATVSRKLVNSSTGARPSYVPPNLDLVYTRPRDPNADAWRSSISILKDFQDNLVNISDLMRNADEGFMYAKNGASAWGNSSNWLKRRAASTSEVAVRANSMLGDLLAPTQDRLSQSIDYDELKRKAQRIGTT